MNIPEVKYNRNLIVLGCSGAGKTTYIKHYAEEYYKTFGRNIYLISPSSEYDNINYITKIPMTENIIDKFRISDLENSLLIIEDIILSDFKNYNICSIVSEICTLIRKTL